MNPPVVLTIAGSDSGGGAGIQADLKAILVNGGHGCSAITAMTAQNLDGVSAIQASTPEFLRRQMDACATGFDIRAIKIGMLANAALIDATAAFLESMPGIPVVLDPVMVATSGAALLENDAVQVLRHRLLPLATLLTPNIPEAELLTGLAVLGLEHMSMAATALRKMGARHVLLKGAHLPDAGDARIRDLLQMEDGKAVTYVSSRLPVEAHGTGCTLSSAVATQLALGLDIEAACQKGIAYVQAALRNGYALGRGSETRILDFLAPAAGRR